MTLLLAITIAGVAAAMIWLDIKRSAKIDMLERRVGSLMVLHDKTKRK